MTTRPIPPPTLREIALPLLGKWVPFIVFHVAAGRGQIGFLGLERSITGISRKVLAENLRTLEACHLIRKHGQSSTGHAVRYELTDLGQEYLALLYPIKQWLQANADRLHPRPQPNKTIL